MKILLIIPTLKQGGAERVMSILANNFSQKNIDTHLIILTKSNDFFTINKKVTIHRIGFENNNFLSKKLSELKTFFRLRKLIKNEKPDFVLSFMEKYNILTILASSFLNANIFISDRRNPLNKLPKHIVFFRRLTYKYATGYIAQTSLARDYIKERKLNKNIRIIHNPVQVRNENETIKHNTTIINVGRLIPEKGQHYLIEAFSKLRNREWKLIILGDGPLRNQLELQIQELNLEDRVILKGTVNNVVDWLKESSIFAFTSITEGFPNALTEAMAVGLPCVSFDCNAGPRDLIINGENGFLIPLKDVESLAFTLDKLADDYLLRDKIGNKAKEIRYKLDENKIAEEFLDFFVSVTQ
ncbi:glycosyltransferase family 4 protein [Xanthomarina sp.]|uniref:glycosyltransferase family 4 protein n=1 Tax=Xanthomarina sp. TaxID=1931211 RepID=UPI002B612A4B|nr:glycosyltransferase family 4 protein [Xanthomarina sp.]HLV39614.1 glycosyltransferase family 4 protein [Xanthomarina sp.]